MLVFWMIQPCTVIMRTVKLYCWAIVSGLHLTIRTRSCSTSPPSPNIYAPHTPIFIHFLPYFIGSCRASQRSGPASLDDDQTVTVDNCQVFFLMKSVPL